MWNVLKREFYPRTNEQGDTKFHMECGSSGLCLFTDSELDEVECNIPFIIYFLTVLFCLFLDSS